MDNVKIQRILYLDLARVCAMFCVILNHTTSKIYDNYNYQMEEFWNSSLLSQVFKAAATTLSWLGVPLFLMITGSLILNKKMDSEKNIEDFYKKNWFQLFISTECWTILGYLFLTLFYNGTLQAAINEPIKWGFDLGLSLLFINKVSFGSLWYMSMILCVYLVLPIFCLYLSRFSLKSLRLPIMIVFLSGFVVPTISKYLAVIGRDVNLNFDLTYAKIFSYFLVFVFVGYYISKGGIKQKSNNFIYCNFIFWFVLTIICQLYGYSQPYNLVTEYNSVGILFSSLFLFEMIRRYEMTQCLSKIILFLSKYCFGIYMVHTFVVWTIYKMVSPTWFNRPFTVLGYTVLAFVISMCVVYILARFKWCRKYLLLIKK